MYLLQSGGVLMDVEDVMDVHSGRGLLMTVRPKTYLPTESGVVLSVAILLLIVLT